MEDAPAGIPSRRVDHLADLVVGKVVGNPSSTFAPLAGLTQQEALQALIQGGESLLWCKPGDQAELLKGEVMAEDRCDTRHLTDSLPRCLRTAHSAGMLSRCLERRRVQSTMASNHDRQSTSVSAASHLAGWRWVARARLPGASSRTLWHAAEQAEQPTEQGETK